MRNLKQNAPRQLRVLGASHNPPHEPDFDVSVPLPKRSQRIPELLTRAEVAHLFAATHNLRHYRLLVTCYGCGLRVDGGRNARIFGEQRFEGLQFPDIVLRNLGLRVKLMAAKMRYVGIWGV